MSELLTNTMPAVIALAVWLASLAGAIWAMSAIYSRHAQRTADHAKTLLDHEQRLRLIERTHSELVTDVRWIRQKMERHQ